MHILEKEKNIISISIFVGIIISLIFLFTTKSYSDSIQKGISEEIIRLHVLANSDSTYDQELKIKVKDGITKLLEKELKNSKSKDETRTLIIKNLDKIEEKAENIIKENGYNYSVNAKISFDKFPTKQYGDIILPTGEYEALKIEIGEAKGKNWWCVMFPPLCFVDASAKVVPDKDKSLLKSVLTEEEFNIVDKAKSENDLPIKLKFKIVEWWQNLNCQKNELYKN